MFGLAYLSRNRQFSINPPQALNSCDTERDLVCTMYVHVLCLQILKYYWPVVSMTAFGAATRPITNYFRRMPLHAGLYQVALGAVAGYFFGHKVRDMNARKNAEEVAVIKHFIKTHPDKFIEPERKRFGDESVLLGWYPCR